MRTCTSPTPALVLRKGIHRKIDSYSTFYENDRTTPTGLVGYLRDRGFTRVFLAGLAFDFCVRYSAEDAQRENFEVVVIEDACRGIDVDGSMAAHARKPRGRSALCAPPPRLWADPARLGLTCNALSGAISAAVFQLQRNN